MNCARSGHAYATSPKKCCQTPYVVHRRSSCLLSTQTPLKMKRETAHASRRRSLLGLVGSGLQAALHRLLTWTHSKAVWRVCQRTGPCKHAWEKGFHASIHASVAFLRNHSLRIENHLMKIWEKSLKYYCATFSIWCSIWARSEKQKRPGNGLPSWKAREKASEKSRRSTRKVEK